MTIATAHRSGLNRRHVPRLLSALGDGLGEHLDRFGGLPRIGADVIRLVAESGLTGRGGGSFPTAQKLAAVAERGGRRVIVNGIEGEPASGKDRVLLRQAPHLVLDGAVLAAQAVGAREAVVAVGGASELELAALQKAINARARRRLDGRVRLRALDAPAAFVAGEETALAELVNGRPARPTFGPKPFEKGILVQNVETVANIALLARFGSSWFREIGTADETGSVLVTLTGAVATRGSLRSGARHGFHRPFTRPAGSPIPRRPFSSEGTSGRGSTLPTSPGSACSMPTSPRTRPPLALGPSSHSRSRRAVSENSPASPATSPAKPRGNAGRAYTDSQRSQTASSALPSGSGATRCGSRAGLTRCVGAAPCRHPDGMPASSPPASRSSQRSRPAPAWPLQWFRPSGAAGTQLVKQLRVNPIACEAHGLCAELFPERVTLDDWGYPIVDPTPILSAWRKTRSARPRRARCSRFCSARRGQPPEAQRRQSEAELETVGVGKESVAPSAKRAQVRPGGFLVGLVCLLMLATAASAAAPNPQVAGLQVALRGHGFYGGPIDAIAGERTLSAITRFQRKAGLVPDGIAGPRTRSALGRLGRPLYRTRTLRRGMVGWDVSVLQYCSSAGFSPGGFNGRFSAPTEAALVRFQLSVKLTPDGIVGPYTARSLREPRPTG